MVNHSVVQGSCLSFNIPASLPSLGNWSPSDFPEGSSWSVSGSSVNRDMLVVMTNPDIVEVFRNVFYKDWAKGKEWVPKSGVGLSPGEL